ncbi:MAG TPA: helix-turn-helix domain-containing protein [Burkholderiales bacterium]|nr:helix-turn-helix domain-containing protein [Burkholderiales bacterium]
MNAVVALPKLLSEEEAAEILKKSVFTLRRMRKAGLIGYIQIGRTVSHTEAQINEFLVKQQCPASESPTNTPSSSARARKTGTSNGESAARKCAALRALDALNQPK